MSTLVTWSDCLQLCHPVRKVMSQQLKQSCHFYMLSAAEVPLVAGQGQPKVTSSPGVSGNLGRRRGAAWALTIPDPQEPPAAC